MYLYWKEKTITDFSESNIESLYNDGYVFTRIDKGVMYQTRSARLNLAKFELSSENRRILKKVGGLTVEKHPIPFPSYSWEIGKLAKDFYSVRGADFSANKVKELITNASQSNFNTLLSFGLTSVSGYAICFETKDIFHYSYPFYNLNAPKDTGLGMMLLAIQKIKEEGRKYFYLGSLQRPTDTYKLQFKGLEWFDSKTWRTDPDAAKKALKI